MQSAFNTLLRGLNGERQARPDAVIVALGATGRGNALLSQPDSHDARFERWSPAPLPALTANDGW